MHRKLALTSLETSYPVPGSNKEALTRTGSLITEVPHPRLSILKSSIKNTVTSSNTAALPLLFYIPPACTRPFEREPPSRALWLCQLTQPVGVGGGVEKGWGMGVALSKDYTLEPILKSIAASWAHRADGRGAIGPSH